MNHAKAMASIVSPKRDVESIADGSEPDDFWEALGGKGDPTAWADEQQPPILEPRLFHCKISPVSGKFRAYQIFNFEQDVSHFFFYIEYMYHTFFSIVFIKFLCISKLISFLCLGYG